MTFAFHTNIMRKQSSFNEFNSLRKNFLISVYQEIKDLISDAKNNLHFNKYRDYYFMP
jgi:hypothetical protein